MATYGFAQYSGSVMIPDDISFGITYNTQISTSPLNGSIKTIELPGARWTARLTYTNLSNLETDTLLAWMARLRGMAQRFTMYDFSQPAASTGSNASTAATISSVTTSGDDVIVNFSGTPTGGQLAPGDKFSVNANNELKVVVAANSTTQYVVEPAFRNQASYYTSKTVGTGTYAEGQFMLTSDEQATKLSSSKIFLGELSIDCVEQF